jgi:hypothetical protein
MKQLLAFVLLSIIWWNGVNTAVIGIEPIRHYSCQSSGACPAIPANANCFVDPCSMNNCTANQICCSDYSVGCNYLCCSGAVGQ